MFVLQKETVLNTRSTWGVKKNGSSRWETPGITSKRFLSGIDVVFQGRTRSIFGAFYLLRPDRKKKKTLLEYFCCVFCVFRSPVKKKLANSSCFFFFPKGMHKNEL